MLDPVAALKYKESKSAHHVKNRRSGVLIRIYPGEIYFASVVTANVPAIGAITNPILDPRAHICDLKVSAAKVEESNYERVLSLRLDTPPAT
ncbi:MAG: hypothetical protein ACLFVK_04340 [Dehalococcoidia bacterium]